MDRNNFSEEDFETLMKIAEDSPLLFIGLSINYIGRMELIRYASYNKRHNRSFGSIYYELFLDDEKMDNLEIWLDVMAYERSKNRN